MAEDTLGCRLTADARQEETGDRITGGGEKAVVVRQSPGSTEFCIGSLTGEAASFYMSHFAAGKGG